MATVKEKRRNIVPNETTFVLQALAELNYIPGSSLTTSQCQAVIAKFKLFDQVVNHPTDRERYKVLTNDKIVGLNKSRGVSSGTVRSSRPGAARRPAAVRRPPNQRDLNKARKAVKLQYRLEQEQNEKQFLNVERLRRLVLIESQIDVCQRGTPTEDEDDLEDEVADNLAHEALSLMDLISACLSIHTDTSSMVKGTSSLLRSDLKDSMIALEDFLFVLSGQNVGRGEECEWASSWWQKNVRLNSNTSNFEIINKFNSQGSCRTRGAKVGEPRNTDVKDMAGGVRGMQQHTAASIKATKKCCAALILASNELKVRKDAAAARSRPTSSSIANTSTIASVYVATAPLPLTQPSSPIMDASLPTSMPTINHSRLITLRERIATNISHLLEDIVEERLISDPHDIISTEPKVTGMFLNPHGSCGGERLTTGSVPALYRDRLDALTIAMLGSTKLHKKRCASNSFTSEMSTIFRSSLHASLSTSFDGDDEEEEEEEEEDREKEYEEDDYDQKEGELNGDMYYDSESSKQRYNRIVEFATNFSTDEDADQSDRDY